ncbi:MAG: polyphosphate kinase 2 [Paracoccaceae bacterium]|nr:polyphosphate kinase 2 [Paracoccaceae bacterium]
MTDWSADLAKTFGQGDPEADADATADKKADKKKGYKQELLDLQIKLVILQKHLIEHDLQVLVIFEGRDAAGKDGVIKRITQHLSPRETRVVALGKPSDREQASWYFQRHVAHLPAEQEMVLMNRSWYNRAGVERVMGFCNELEYQAFLRGVVPFEHNLVRAGIQVLKYYLDISRDEQAERLEDRRVNPLKQWKISPIDAVALEKFDAYSAARDAMFVGTHNELTPWTIVRTDDKKTARLNIIRDMLARIESPERHEYAEVPDRSVVFEFAEECLTDGRLAR